VIELGTIVNHPKRPGWGPGKTLAIEGGGKVTVYFRDLEEGKAGDAVKTISTTVVGLLVADEQDDQMLDNLPPYTKGKFEGIRKPRLSLDQAVQAYLEANPKAFDDDADTKNDRSPKVRAHETWVEKLGGGQGEALLDQGKVDEISAQVLEIGAEVNLLTPSEKAALAEAFDDEAAAQQFLRALLKVVDQSTPEQTSYQELIDAVHEFPIREEGAKVAVWPVLTQFPFIARPEHHMHLKPTMVQKCAARLNFDLRPTAALNWWTYDRLLKMSGIILERLKPEGARDFIDVQSFAWWLAKA
jgi:hypothetical protein